MEAHVRQGVSSSTTLLEIHKEAFLDVCVIGEILFVRKSIRIDDDDDWLRPVLELTEGVEPISREVVPDPSYMGGKREDISYMLI